MIDEMHIGSSSICGVKKHCTLRCSSLVMAVSEAKDHSIDTLLDVGTESGYC